MPTKFTMLKTMLVGLLKMYKRIKGMNSRDRMIRAYFIISESVLLLMREPKKSLRNKVKKRLPIITSGMLNNLNHHESSAASLSAKNNLGVEIKKLIPVNSRNSPKYKLSFVLVYA